MAVDSASDSWSVRKMDVFRTAETRHLALIRRHIPALRPALANACRVLKHPRRLPFAVAEVARA